MPKIRHVPFRELRLLTVNATFISRSGILVCLGEPTPQFLLFGRRSKTVNLNESQLQVLGNLRTRLEVLCIRNTLSLDSSTPVLGKRCFRPHKHVELMKEESAKSEELSHD